MNALIIEDSPVFRQMVQHTLEELGFQTECAELAAEGMAALEQRRFDLLILDLHLPDQSGLEIARRIRAQAAHRLLPILMLTSDDSKLLMQRALDAGVTELFRKTKIAELHDSLREYIARMQRQLKGRVMLIEDSPTTSELLAYMLNRMNLEVDRFETGEAALEAITKSNYDLIVSDIVLAGQMTGLGVTRAIRSMEGEVSRTPILGLSALEDAARKIEMLKMGANDYVSKPVVEEEFVARVGNLISSKQLFDQVQQQRRELRERSIRDALTGLYNRHYLSEVSSQLFAHADRQQRPLSVMMVDLDHFKKINDTYGHDVGDKVLASVGQLLAQDCRQGDVAARFGGEEFVILLPDCTQAAATQRAERLLADLRALKPADITVTASIGISAQGSSQIMGFDQLFKMADEAVYEAKQSGRNKVVTREP
ncbi:MAG TPA: diguanylate cyclase [Burkholderiaceae bacterium]|jgi:two-component system cell cycle response regulator